MKRMCHFALVTGTLIGWLESRYEGRDFYGVVVEVRGAHGSILASLIGHGQASATAIGAAALVRALAEGEVEQPGVWLAEQVVPTGPFFERLAARGMVPKIEERPADSPLVSGVSA